MGQINSKRSWEVLLLIKTKHYQSMSSFEEFKDFISDIIERKHGYTNRLVVFLKEMILERDHICRDILQPLIHKSSKINDYTLDDALSRATDLVSNVVYIYIYIYIYIWFVYFTSNQNDCQH